MDQLECYNLLLYLQNFDFEVWLRARLVTKTFEKWAPSVTWVEFFVASRRCPPQNQHFQIPIRSGNSGQREQTFEMSIGKFPLFPFDL